RRLFKLCGQLGISLITISHRPALHEFHDHMVTLDGCGGYTITAIEGAKASKAPLKASESLRSFMRTGALPFTEIVSRLERTGSLQQLGGNTLVAGDQSSQVVRSHRITCPRPAVSSLPSVSILRLVELLGPVDGPQGGRLLGLLSVIIGRTYVSNRIAHINGHALRLLMQRRTVDFHALVVNALLMGLVQAVLSPLGDVLEAGIADYWRRQLTKRLTTVYFEGSSFYHLVPPEGGPDQVIVEDV
ncbi:ATP-binding cassette sub- D member 3, partial [Perkinsus olseni]